MIAKELHHVIELGAMQCVTPLETEKTNSDHPIVAKSAWIW